jgi:hypothetical protein
MRSTLPCALSPNGEISRVALSLPACRASLVPRQGCSRGQFRDMDGSRLGGLSCTRCKGFLEVSLKDLGRSGGAWCAQCPRRAAPQPCARRSVASGGECSSRARRATGARRFDVTRPIWCSLNRVPARGCRAVARLPAYRWRSRSSFSLHPPAWGGDDGGGGRRRCWQGDRGTRQRRAGAGKPPKKRPGGPW